MPAGLPSGMLGMAEVMDAATQQAPQFALHFMTAGYYIFNKKLSNFFTRAQFHDALNSQPTAKLGG